MNRTKVEEAKERGLERILSEFPWLWAVEPLWCYRLDTVRVKNATMGFFSENTPPFCWIKTRDLISRESAVSQIMKDVREDESIAQAIHEDLTRHSKTAILESVVVRTSFTQVWPEGEVMPANPALRRFYKEYVVYRPGTGLGTFQSMLERHLRDSAH